MVQGQADQGFVHLIAATKKRDSQVVMLQPRLVCFQILGCQAESFLGDLPVLLSLGDLPSENVIGEPQQRDACLLVDRPYFVAVALCRIEVVEVERDPAENHKAQNAP